MAVERQSATLPPAWPSCILRGHATAIQTVQFVRQNGRLLTGDADGWVIFWKVETKRALVVWRAHHGPILGTAEWGDDNIITHGRDNTLRIWQIRGEENAVHNGHFSNILPTEPNRDEELKPWLLHTLPVNTLNFCAFSMCYQNPPSNIPVVDGASSRQEVAQPRSSSDSILIAVVARDDKKMEVYELPAEKLRFVIPRVQAVDTELNLFVFLEQQPRIILPKSRHHSTAGEAWLTGIGMVMAVKLVHHQPLNNILLLAGYEGGVTAAFMLSGSSVGSVTESAQLLYLSKPHDQPILSLDASPDGKEYFTSSADAKIAMHRIPDMPPDMHEEVQHREDNESSLDSERQSSLRDEQVQTCKLPPPVVAQDDVDIPGASSQPFDPATSFAKQTVGSSKQETPMPSGLSSLLSSAEPQANIQSVQLPPPVVTVQPPYKINNTKHAGQQSLRVRSDGRLVVTGGWDARVRIYSAKTLKEVAVLKWHKEGVYAVTVGDILKLGELRQTDLCQAAEAKERVRYHPMSLSPPTRDEELRNAWSLEKINNTASENHGGSMTSKSESGPDYEHKKIVSSNSDETTNKTPRKTRATMDSMGVSDKVHRDREAKVMLTHWVAAGAKDGKVSLWEVF